MANIFQAQIASGHLKHAPRLTPFNLKVSLSLEYSMIVSEILQKTHFSFPPHLLCSCDMLLSTQKFLLRNLLKKVIWTPSNEFLKICLHVWYFRGN